MSDLEQAGLLYAPHTSAGRVPTETGLRMFVDGLMEYSPDLVSEDRISIDGEVRRAGSPSMNCWKTSRTLSGLSLRSLVLSPASNAELSISNSFRLASRAHLVRWFAWMARLKIA